MSDVWGRADFVGEGLIGTRACGLSSAGYRPKRGGRNGAIIGRWRLVRQSVPAPKFVSGNWNHAGNTAWPLDGVQKCRHDSGAIRLEAIGGMEYRPRPLGAGFDGVWIMTDFSWRAWLGLNRGARSTAGARKSGRGNRSSIEDLEVRALLTAQFPLAVDDAFTINEDQSLAGASVLSNDTDGTGGPVDTGIVENFPLHGSLNFHADGSFIYTPHANFHGIDGFTYYARDTASGATSPLAATVSITVLALNDAPVASAAAASTPANLNLRGTLTASDVDGQAVTFHAGAVQPSHGRVSIAADGTYSYSPEVGFNGFDSFSFKVADGSVESADALVLITVSNVAPVTSNGAGITDEDSPLQGSLSPLGVDANGDTLAYTVVTPPAHGSLVLSPDGIFVFTPHVDYNGVDSFTFRANDGLANSPVATYQISVSPVDDEFGLSRVTSSTTVLRDYQLVPVDPGAKVRDVDSQVSYNSAQITVTILDGGSSRDVLSIKNQGTGAGLVKVKGTRIYYNGSTKSIGTFSGGSNKPLRIVFSVHATEAGVNAVLGQIGFKTSFKGGSGMRTIQYLVNAGGNDSQHVVNVDVV